MKRLVIYILLALTMAIPAALAAAPARAAEVGDMAGRRVAVPDAPRRIVALGPGALRLVCYIQAQDRVVGIEDFERKRPQGRPYWYANPGLAKLPTVSPGGPGMINKLPDMERMLAVRPQVIFVTYMDAAKAQQLQDQLRVPVVVLSYGRLANFDESVYRSLRLLGQVLGKVERAEAVVDFLEQARQDLARRVAGVPERDKPTVYVGAVGFRGFQGITSTDAAYVPTLWVAARNVVSGRGGEHLFVGKEDILAWNPQVVFLDGTGLNLVAKDYQKNPGFYRGLKAFGQGRVYVLHPFVYYVTNLGTTISSAYGAGKVLYPDRFQDVDLAAKSDQVYRFLVSAPVYARMAAFFGPLAGKPGFLR